MKKQGQVYVCPKCGNKVELFVTPTEPPNCANHDAHKTRRYIEMELVEEQ